MIYIVIILLIVAMLHQQFQLSMLRAHLRDLNAKMKTATTSAPTTAEPSFTATLQQGRKHVTVVVKADGEAAAVRELLRMGHRETIVKLERNPG